MTKKTVETWFDQETGRLLLQLEKADVGLGEEAIQFAGITFQPKDEVHITIIGSGLGEKVKAILAADESAETRLQQIIHDTNWSYRLQDKWYHVVEGEAQTIIRMADVPATPAFFDRLNRLLGLEAEIPPTHVTLYTYKKPGGIGIANRAEFDALVQRAVAPEALVLMTH